MIVMKSSKPNNQRRSVGEANLSERRNLVSAHLSKELRGQYKRRSMAIRRGDEVKIIRGDQFGKAGLVTGIDTKKAYIFVNGVTLKRTIGTEKQIPIEPSNVVITGLELNDNERQRILLRKVKDVKVEPKKVPAEEKRQEAAPAEAKKDLEIATVEAKPAAAEAGAAERPVKSEAKAPAKKAPAAHKKEGGA